MPPLSEEFKWPIKQQMHSGIKSKGILYENLNNIATTRGGAAAKRFEDYKLRNHTRESRN